MVARSKPLLFQLNSHAGCVPINLNSNVIESWLSPSVEGMPKTAWLLGAKNTHVEHAIIVLIFEGTQCPTARRNLELKAGDRSGFNANALYRLLQEVLRIPKCHVNRMFARASDYFSGEIDAVTTVDSGWHDEYSGNNQNDSQKKSLIHLIHS